MIKNNSFFIKNPPLSAKELANKLSIAQVIGNENILLSGVATIENAQSSDITFLSNYKYAHCLKDTKAGACILHQSFLNKNIAFLSNKTMTFLVSSNPYLDYARTIDIFYIEKYQSSYNEEYKPIDSSAIIGKNCIIESGVTIGKNAVIEDFCHIMANSFIGAGVTIGSGTIIHSNVTISYAYIGSKCIIHSGVRIGQDGFGFIPSSQGIIKIKQIGSVIIGNRVEIGANTCIDRGAISNTVIEDDCKLDNLIQIGHNVIIGKGCLIAGQTGIAGSTKIGEYTMIGGQVGISGHLNIGRKVNIAAQSGVIRDVPDGSVIGGTPSVSLQQWHRQSVFLEKSVTSKKIDNSIG